MKKYVKIIILFSLIMTCLCTINTSKVLADDRIYWLPEVTRNDPKDNLGDLINDAEKFENQSGPAVGMGNNSGTEFKLDTSQLKSMSSNIYTMFIIVATAICLIVGIIIGIKFITGSVEAQAETKKLLKPYLIGCAVIFGAFGIWSLVVNILSVV